MTGPPPLFFLTTACDFNHVHSLSVSANGASCTGAHMSLVQSPGALGLHGAMCLDFLTCYTGIIMYLPMRSMCEFMGCTEYRTHLALSHKEVTLELRDRRDMGLLYLGYTGIWLTLLIQGSSSRTLGGCDHWGIFGQFVLFFFMSGSGGLFEYRR